MCILGQSRRARAGSERPPVGRQLGGGGGFRHRSFRERVSSVKLSYTKSGVPGGGEVFGGGGCSLFVHALYCKYKKAIGSKACEMEKVVDEKILNVKAKHV